MKKQYTKPALSLEQQADLLLKKGLNGISKQQLIQKLNSINYYRLRGYTYPYQDNTKSESPFICNVKWDLIWNDYVFDSKLRSLITESIGHIEIALRTQLELQMSLSYGSRWYENEDLFHSKKSLLSDRDELLGHWKRSRETFKEHYENDYDTSLNPPAWMIFETTTFGTVSKFFSNIKNNIPAKTEISKFFGFNKASTKVFISWMQHLNLVRNICAHHSRLFSRSFIVKPIIPTSKPEKWVTEIPAQDRVFFSICIITYLLDICAPEFSFRERLKETIGMVRPKQLPTMGFPPDWEQQELFKTTETETQPNYELCLRMADAFKEVGGFADNKDLENDMGSKYLFPMAVNYCFACELYLKILLAKESKTSITGHELYKLYSKLSEPTKNILIKNFKVNRNKELSNFLKEHSNHFINFRYAFENRNKNDLVVHVDDMRCFLKILRDEIQKDKQ